jgi:CheY-like chemotaxis protein
MSEIHTILIVEDNATDVMLIRRAFAKLNIANPVQIVGDGDRAVDYLSGKDAYGDRAQFPLPAFVLLDLKLPRRSGLEVLAWLRAQDGLRRLPVVMLTSSRQSQDVDRAYELGANSYLVKPVEFDDLQELLGTINTYWITYNEKPHIAPTVS